MSVEFITAPGLEDVDRIRHGFFTRRGGISEGVYASLNCGPGSGDDPGRVEENRARALKALGVSGNGLVTAFQVHSPDVAVVSTPGENPGRVDAMVTKTPGLALGVLTADCAPVLFCDADAGIAAAAHAGWKGALAGVLEAVIAAMEGLGAKTNTISAAIGPCIQQASYEVGEDFRDTFTEEHTANRAYFSPGSRDGHFQFDLAGFTGSRLKALGLKSVAALDFDTYADEALFFSYRRNTHASEAEYGRMLSAIVLDG